MNTKTDLNIGDLLYRSKGIVQHVGVYLGNNSVIHNSPDGDIQEVSFEEFSEYKTVKVEKVGLTNISILIERLEYMRYSTAKYSMSNNNCEQFARKLLGMRASSPQVTAVMTGAVVGTLVSVIAEKSLFWSVIIGGATALTLANYNKKYDGLILPINER
jgi:hypothetical protein